MNLERRSANVLLIFSRHMKKSILLASLLFLQCTKENNPIDRELHYFDTRGVIENTISKLSQEKPKVVKLWKYGRAEEKRMVEDMDWEKELKLFLDADINKSSFIGSYDSTRAGQMITYSLKSNENLPVKILSVSQDSTDLEIHAIRTSENYFFTTYGDLLLRIKDEKLDSYNIHTVQKLLWFDADTTVVSGKVLY
ncbi:hypothetical protein Lbys_0463 [Leadbetterella byssophila DSM 17132]|uniref:Uncharacterized protein n=2 Tax=Leadbetterella TaxID=319458 RepID=E4RWR9_LEAB4|nr:hypothetical protein Lbys_0463 [Leadbetterella byssophila DSM 17132]